MNQEYYYNPKLVPEYEHLEPLVDISHLTKDEKIAAFRKGSVYAEFCETEEELETFIAVKCEWLRSVGEDIICYWGFVELCRWAWLRRRKKYGL